jgi:hypothetical protein
MVPHQTVMDRKTPLDSAKSAITELASLRHQFGRPAREQKATLLQQLGEQDIRDVKTLVQLHETACFVRAFADGPDVFEQAGKLLDSFGTRIATLPRKSQKLLADTGLAATPVHYEFSHEIVQWLLRKHRGQVDIDWRSYEDPEQLDDLLDNLLTHAEQPMWEDGQVSTREWIKRAMGACNLTDLEWILKQFPPQGDRRRAWATQYDNASVPITWPLSESRSSRTLNEIKWLAHCTPRNKWRTARAIPSKEIARPLSGIKRLPPGKAADVIDASRAALAARHREVYAITYANPDEIYLAPIGQGAHVAVLGVVPEYRLSIEANYGYVIFSHGRPIGYGGVSPLFKQANTGVNIFDEYRRGESRFLFIQVLRTFHMLFQSTRFVANPYQFGAENDEAVATGAFWAYYKIGFRPMNPTLARKADAIASTRAFKKGVMPPKSKLKELLGSDLELKLPGAKTSDYFDERFLNTLSEQVTVRIAQTGPANRKKAIATLVADVAKQLKVTNSKNWSTQQRQSFARFAPIVALITDLDTWPIAAKRSLAKLMLAKGAPQEREYAQRLFDSDRLRDALRRVACRAQ